MKKYKLLKDLPFAKAGDILSLERSQEYGYFKLCKDRSNPRSIELYEGIVEGFIYKSKFKEINTDYYSGWSALEVKNIEDLGLLFKTVEKTKKYLKYLKAKEIIKQDTKGFKPDWENPSQKRFFGYYNLIDKKLCYFNAGENMESKIYFGSKEDIKESFKKHPKEWKTYLFYEQ